MPKNSGKKKHTCADIWKQEKDLVSVVCLLCSLRDFVQFGNLSEFLNFVKNTLSIEIEQKSHQRR